MLFIYFLLVYFRHKKLTCQGKHVKGIDACTSDKIILIIYNCSESLPCHKKKQNRNSSHIKKNNTVPLAGRSHRHRSSCRPAWAHRWPLPGGWSWCRQSPSRSRRARCGGPAGSTGSARPSALSAGKNIFKRLVFGNQWEKNLLINRFYLSINRFFSPRWFPKKESFENDYPEDFNIFYSNKLTMGVA